MYLIQRFLVVIIVANFSALVEVEAQSTPIPTLTPSVQPTEIPTVPPSSQPTSYPTVPPTSYPTVPPTSLPSTPTSSPSAAPTPLPSPIPSCVPSQEPTIRPSNVPSTSPTTLATLAPTFSPEEYLAQSTFSSDACTDTPLSTIVYVLNVCSLGSTFVQLLPDASGYYVVATYDFTVDGLIAINVNKYSTSTCTGTGSYISSSFVQLSTACSSGVIYAYSGIAFPTLSLNQAQQTTYFLSIVCASNTAFQYQYQYSGQCTPNDEKGLSSSPTCSGGGNFVLNYYLGTSCQGPQQGSITTTVPGCLKQTTSANTANYQYYIKQQCSSGTSGPAVVAAPVSLMRKKQPDSSLVELSYESDREQYQMAVAGFGVAGSNKSELNPPRIEGAESSGVAMGEELALLRSLSTDDRLNPTIAPTKAPSGFGSLGYLMSSTFSNTQCIGSIIEMTAVPTGVCINSDTSSAIFIYTAAPGLPYITQYTYETTLNCIGDPSTEDQTTLDGQCTSSSKVNSFSTAIQFQSGGYISELYYRTSTCSGSPYETVWQPFIPCSATTLLNSGSGDYYSATSASSNGLTTTYYATSLCSGTVVATSTTQYQSSCIVTMNNGTTSAASQSYSTSLYSTQSSANTAVGLSTGGAVGIAIACIVIVAGAVAVAVYFNYSRLFGPKTASEEPKGSSFGVNAEMQVSTSQSEPTTSKLHDPLV